MYDPELMRFTGYDPVRGKFGQPLTLHVYLYCANNSINRIDPTGKTAWNIFGALSAGTAVRSAATLMVAKGFNVGNDFMFDAGLHMHHAIAPVMYVGAFAGPLLPAGGSLAIKGVAGIMHAITAGATGLTGKALVLGREIITYAVTHPYQLINAVDAAAVLCADTMYFDTPAGNGALMIKTYIDNNY